MKRSLKKISFLFFCLVGLESFTFAKSEDQDCATKLINTDKPIKSRQSLIDCYRTFENEDEKLAMIRLSAEKVTASSDITTLTTLHRFQTFVEFWHFYDTTEFEKVIHSSIEDSSLKLIAHEELDYDLLHEAYNDIKSEPATMNALIEIKKRFVDEKTPATRAEFNLIKENLAQIRFSSGIHSKETFEFSYVVYDEFLKKSVLADFLESYDMWTAFDEIYNVDVQLSVIESLKDKVKDSQKIRNFLSDAQKLSKDRNVRVAATEALNLD